MQSIKFVFQKEEKFNVFFVFKIREDVVQALIDFYQKLPTAKYYEVASFNYKHGKKTTKI